MSNQLIIPKVSILVPTYNRSKYLQQTITSILAQSFKDFEVIVADNCSTDDTLAVVESFADSRIVYCRNSYNIGPILNHNVALRHASGQYIYIFSDDDLMSGCTNLAQKVAVLDQHPTVVLVHSDINIINSDNDIIGANWAACHKDWPRVLREAFMPGATAYDILYYGHNFVNMPTVMLRKSILDEYKLEFNNQLGYLVDWNLWLQLSLLGDFYYLDDIMVSYRLHGQNESLKLNKELMFRELILAKIGLSTIYGDIFPKAEKDIQNILLSTRRQLEMDNSPTQKRKFVLKVRAILKRVFITNG